MWDDTLFLLFSGRTCNNRIATYLIFHQWQTLTLWHQFRAISFIYNTSQMFQHIFQMNCVVELAQNLIRPLVVGNQSVIHNLFISNHSHKNCVFFSLNFDYFRMVDFQCNFSTFVKDVVNATESYAKYPKSFQNTLFSSWMVKHWLVALLHLKKFIRFEFLLLCVLNWFKSSGCHVSLESNLDKWSSVECSKIIVYCLNIFFLFSLHFIRW